MPFIASNGVQLHYQRAGQGPDVVMIHGLAANIAFWYLNIVPRLASDFRLAVYDLRGHGRSDMPHSGYDLRSMSDDLAAMMDELGIARAHLVGHSFGGSIALKYALEHPDRVKTITLADAALPGLQPLDDGRDWAYWKAWRRELLALGITVPRSMPKVAYGLLEELADPRWAEARQRNTSNSVFVPFGLWNGARRSALRWRQLLRTTSAWTDFQSDGHLTLERIGELRQPVLSICGERSRWLRGSQILSETLPDCRTVVLPAVGHFHPILQPEVFAAHLREFLKGVPA